MALRKWVFIISLLALLTTGGIIFISTLIGKEAHEAVTNEFVNHMLGISKGSIIAIKNEFNSVKRALKLLRDDVKQHNYSYESESAKEDFLVLYNNIDFLAISDAAYLDENGILKHNAKAPQIIGKDFSFRKYFQTIKSKNDPSFMAVELIEFKGADKGKIGLMFALGIFEDAKDGGAPILKGVVAVTSYLDSFIEKYIKPMQIGHNGYQWFFWSTGEMLYHPNIPIGVTYQKIKSSELYSKSFKNAIGNILNEEAFTGNYEENGKNFVYAASAVNVGADNWYFAVSIPKEETNSILRRYSKFNLLLMVTTFFAVSLLGVFLMLILYVKNQNLLQMVDLKTYQLEYTRKKNKELDAIIHTIAHDLKNPITSIKWIAEILMNQLSTKKFDEKSAKYPSTIYYSANYMNELIDSLLEFARVGETANTIEDVSLKEVLKEVKLYLDYELERRGGAISMPETLPIIKGDKVKLNQLFLNLISNAIKFVPNDRIPKIEVTFNESNEFYNISISDNGIGIEESDMKNLFNLFFRVKEIDVEGTGIGLSIVKKIVEDHNGNITVKSKKGEGATFTVSINKM